MPPLAEAELAPTLKRRCCACNAANVSIAILALSIMWNSSNSSPVPNEALRLVVTYSGMTRCTSCANTPRACTSSTPRTRRHSSDKRNVRTGTFCKRCKMPSTSASATSRARRASAGLLTCASSVVPNDDRPDSPN